MSKVVRSARLLFEHTCLCERNACPGQLLLLVLGHDSRGQKRWTLPGGRSQGKETPLETVLRELWEETGHKVPASELLLSPASLFWWESEREGLRAEYTFYSKRYMRCDDLPQYAPLPSEDDEIRAELVPLDAITSGTASVRMKRRHREKLVRARGFFSHAESSCEEEISIALQIPEFVFPMV